MWTMLAMLAISHYYIGTVYPIYNVFYFPKQAYDLENFQFYFNYGSTFGQFI